MGNNIQVKLYVYKKGDICFEDILYNGLVNYGGKTVEKYREEGFIVDTYETLKPLLDAATAKLHARINKEQGCKIY
jgi:hypothetical protein